MSAALASEALASYGAAFESARALAGETEAARVAGICAFRGAWVPGCTRRGVEVHEPAASRVAPVQGGAAIAPTHRTRPGVASLSPHRIVLVNGAVAERSGLPAGMRVRTLDEALRDGEPQSTLLRVPSGGGTERFAALNVALCADTLVVDIDERAAPGEPLHLVLVSAGAEARMAHPRVLIRAARASTARIILHHAGDDAAEQFVNSFVEVERGQ